MGSVRLDLEVISYQLLHWEPNQTRRIQAEMGNDSRATKVDIVNTFFHVSLNELKSNELESVSMSQQITIYEFASASQWIEISEFDSVTFRFSTLIADPVHVP